MNTTATIEPPAGQCFRQFRTDLEVVRAKGAADDRIVRGIAVPWDIQISVDGWLTESFRRGAVDHQLNPGGLQRIKFSNEHMYQGGKVVGVTRVLKNDTKGLYGEWYVSATKDGDDALTLAVDKALDQLSVGFRERPDGDEWPINPATGRPDGRTVIRKKVDLFEVALVPEGAYGTNAPVTGFRSAKPGESREDHLRAVLEAWGAEPWQIDAASVAILGPTQTADVVTSVLAAHPSLNDLLANLS